MGPQNFPAVVVDRRYRRKSLVAAIGFSRMLHAAVTVFEGDLELCAIFIAIACASTSATLRDPDVFADLDEREPVPDSYHRPVSRRAIAASTGLARETVRRKVAQLVERELIVEEPEGVRTPSGVLEPMLELAWTIIQEIERSAAELKRVDEVTGAPAPQEAPEP
jgi:hypothetical protein